MKPVEQSSEIAFSVPQGSAPLDHQQGRLDDLSGQRLSAGEVEIEGNDLAIALWTEFRRWLNKRSEGRP